MKRLLPVLSLALSSAAIAFFLMQNYLLGAGLAFAGYLLTFPVLLKPSKPQLAVSFVAAAVGAASVEMIGWVPLGLLATAIMLAALAMNLRLLFYVQLNRSSKLWLEPLLILVSLALYVFANLTFYGDWQHWALPGLFLLMSTFAVIGSLFDHMKITAFAKSGYKVKIGMKAPDFILKNEEGVEIKLSDFKGRRHVLLIFYRGDWCPYCNMMLRTYAKDAPKFQKKNIMLLAIGPDDPATNLMLVQNMNLDFHVLSDPDMLTVQKYGIQVSNHNPSGRTKYNDDSPLPASFLVDKSGTMRYTSHPNRVGEYLDPGTIFPVIDKLEA